MNVLVFDVWSSLAHFRKYYTTSSALTYPFPTPTALRGLIGAILGYGREEYLEKTKELLLSVKILNPIKLITLSVNLVNTKGSSGFEPTLKKGRTQAIVYLLKEPKYRIFVGGNGDVFDRLEKHIRNREFVYTPCLGTSEHLAEIEYVDTLYASRAKNIKSKCHSVVPVDLLEDIEITSIKLGKERVPVDMRSDRSEPRYSDMLYSKDPEIPIEGVFKELWIINGQGIAFFRASDE